RAAALLVSKPCQRSQPSRHRARFIGGEGAEFGTYASALEDSRARLRAWYGAIAAKQGGHVNREPGIPNPTGETRNMRADARLLRHHNDCWPRAGHVHRFDNTVESDFTTLEVLKCIVLFHRAFRHRCPLSDVTFAHKAR